jgi:hypothetical protein
VHSPPINLDHILSAGKCKLFRSQVKQFAFKIDGLEQIDRFHKGNLTEPPRTPSPGLEARSSAI